MPCYPFVCNSCGSQFERRISVSEYDAGGHTCDCGSENVKRDWSAVRVLTGETYGLHMDALEQQFWHGHKKYIEKNKDKFKSGEWSLEGKNRLREFEPDLKG